MVKHSKNSGSAPIRMAAERRGNTATQSTRIGTNSQLPFGYCALSNSPIEPIDGDAVATPSGRIYRKEHILEHILIQTQEIRARKDKEKQEKEEETKKAQREEKELKVKEAEDFAQQQILLSISNETADSNANRNADSNADSNANSKDSDDYKAQGKRKRLIDDTTDEERIRALSKQNPWLPGFSSEVAQSSNDKVVRVRPTSPFSQLPLRAKDLIPLTLIKDTGKNEGVEGTIQYICSVSKKTITSQPVVVLKNTGVVIIESVAEIVVYPDGRCPISGQKFKKDKDVLRLLPSSTGFSSSGNVESSKWKPNVI
jgi:hypothetical protein